MISLQDFCGYTDELLQSSSIDDMCPNGLQVEGKGEVRLFATAVSASLDALEQAVSLGVDLLLVHHGMFWKGTSQVVMGVQREKIKQLITHGLSLVAYHLPLDAHVEYGNNWKAAEDLGWKDLMPFGNYHGTLIGVKGTFPPRSREELSQQLQEYYHHDATVAFGGKERVASAALISGGSYRSLSEAAREGVDCFVTGNFDEPAWHMAYEEKINFFALGHAATERVGPYALGEHLSKHFRLGWHHIESANPF